MGCTSSVEIVVEEKVEIYYPSQVIDEEELPMPTTKPRRSFSRKFTPKFQRFFGAGGGSGFYGRPYFFGLVFCRCSRWNDILCIYIYIYHAYIFHVFFGDLFVHQILRDLLTANSEPSSKRDNQDKHWGVTIIVTTVLQLPYPPFCFLSLKQSLLEAILQDLFFVFPLIFHSLFPSRTSRYLFLVLSRGKRAGHKEKKIEETYYFAPG